MKITNKFGTGDVYTLEDVLMTTGRTGRIVAYCTSAACMSVTSDMKSWVGVNHSVEKIIFVSKNVAKNNNMIIVLGCQVTDLAILNSIRLVEKLHEENPTALVYVGGCLAYRFDVELPPYAHRLASARCTYTPTNSTWSQTINWEKPFWVKEADWEANKDSMAEGRLFRDMYALKIGAGCNGKCTYCNVNSIRGVGYEADAYLQVKEFIDNEDVVLVSDSPTSKQIKDWCHIATRYNKHISIRNIEPRVLCDCVDELRALAKNGLLKVLHCPLQSLNEELLKVMGRDVDDTSHAYLFMQELRRYGVKIATNFIIDYTTVVKNSSEGDSIKVYKNMDKAFFDRYFDYWSWNPYFDGKFNREIAEKRFDYYINNQCNETDEFESNIVKELNN